MSERVRSATDYVQLKIRCREKLRAQLEAKAEESNHSLNQEIVWRLEDSLSDDAQAQLKAPLLGGWKTDRLCTEIEKAVRFFGVDCSPGEEPVARAMLLGAITQILNERLSGWGGGLMGNPSAEPRGVDGLVTITPELEERARSRGAMIGHHITLATRTAELETSRPLPEMPEADLETLLQSATRLGLVSKEDDPAIAEPQKTNKKGKKGA